MRALSGGMLMLGLALAGCHRSGEADAVRQAYDNHAEQLDNIADRQSTDVAQEIYHGRADAFRDEGKERATAIEKGMHDHSTGVGNPGAHGSGQPDGPQQRQQLQQ